ncbi:metallophosphoesterase family protein [Allosphingosinicella sp.]|jgi:3',5'-cyclic AMP phosphodiesterase CpdA|uniref:metallophosphoesterase family protein n=1 Tax=Allosphingosinicella sp. TaxID=2823234 RepID=UPI002EFE7A32
MATIAHLSDLHFGAHEPKVVDSTGAWLREHRPDLVIISGDFTQRAREEQFREASAWLNRLRSDGFNLLAVPGNHDVPLYDLARRFTRPLSRYKRYISNDLCPWFENDRLAVLGINTARSLTIKDGRINREQMEIIRERFRDVPEHKTRILVTHHPLFAMPIGEGNELSEAVGRHEDAIKAVCEAGVHIALAGHFHRTYAEAAGRMVQNAGGALVIQAGTATSVRLRNSELQSFNWIETHKNNEIDLQVVAWDGARFKARDRARYTFDGQNWNARPAVEATELEAGAAA